MASADLIDHLAGVAPGSPLDAVRQARPEVRQLSQASFDALFETALTGDLPLEERLLTALHAATANALPALIELYEGRLAALGTEPALIAAVRGAGDTSVLSPRMAAILAHADLLTHRPAAATPADLAKLAAAGLSTRAIVTLSQLIAFIGYQARVVVGLQLLEPSA